MKSDGIRGSEREDRVGEPLVLLRCVHDCDIYTQNAKDADTEHLTL